jgi:hypothetical protein
VVDSIGRSGEEITPETEDVAVPCVDAGNRPPSHSGDIGRHRHARDGCPAKVVIGNQERVGHRSEHADLSADMGEIRPSRRLDLTDNGKSLGLEKRR